MKENTQTRNEAAARLPTTPAGQKLDNAGGWYDAVGTYVREPNLTQAIVAIEDDAAAAERRATVERIREAVKNADGPTEYESAIWYSHVLAILDEEAQR